MAHCRIKPGVICLAFSQPPTPKNDGRSTTSPGLRFDNGVPPPPPLVVERERDEREGDSTSRRHIQDLYSRIGFTIGPRERQRADNVAYKFTKNHHHHISYKSLREVTCTSTRASMLKYSGATGAFSPRPLESRLSDRFPRQNCRPPRFVQDPTSVHRDTYRETFARKNLPT